MSMNLSRQIGTLPLEKLASQVTIIGAGGIGSWTTLTLAKMGYSALRVFDFDTIEDVNIPNQCYAPKQIGMLKVEALRDVVKLMTGTEIEARTETITKDMSLACDTLIVAVDSMAVRKEVAEAVKDLAFVTGRVIDARMAIETGLLYQYNKESVEKYLKTLYTDAEGVQEPCTNKAIAYTTNIIAGLVAKAVSMDRKLTGQFSLEMGNGRQPDFMFRSGANDATRSAINRVAELAGSALGEHLRRPNPFDGLTPNGQVLGPTDGVTGGDSHALDTFRYQVTARQWTDFNSGDGSGGERRVSSQRPDSPRVGPGFVERGNTMAPPVASTPDRIEVRAERNLLTGEMNYVAGGPRRRRASQVQAPEPEITITWSDEAVPEDMF